MAVKPGLRPLLAIVSLLVFTAAPAGAVGRLSGDEDARDWVFMINFPMVWLPDIDGEIDVDGRVIEVDRPISDTLEKLELGYIGEFYARRGRWSFGLRTMFLGTREDSRVGPLGLPGLPPLVGEHEISLEGHLFTSDLLAAYSVNDHFGLYTGVRRSGMKLDIKTREIESGIVDLPHKVEVADEELYDWVGGVMLEYPFGDSRAWRAVLEADTLIDGDNNENYQANAFFSYRFSQRHAVWFGYRYLRMVQDMKVEGSAVETDFTQQGPTMGWAFSF